MRLRSALCFVVLVLVAGCLTPPGHVSFDGCTGELLSAGEIPAGDFTLREQVRLVGEEAEVAFELLVERRGERLVLVGLDGFGARVFSVIQEGVRVESESRLGRLAQVPPESVLLDLYAARLIPANWNERAEVHRPGCDYTATFVAVEHIEAD